MTVRVRLFAILRERAGREALELELPEGSTVADLLATLATEPGLERVLDRIGVRAAVNREYVEESTELHAGDEIALVPPVSGGSGPEHGSAVVATISDEPLDPAALTRSVIRPGAGAVVAFQGTTRELPRLEYEAYREMAQERIAAILGDCVERHGLEAAAAAHRVGAVELSEPSVVVAVSAPHREGAFAGAREAIDRIKAEAPIWKQEVDGEGGAQWVDGATPPADAGPPSAGLTHIDESGRARMVDVSAKPTSARRARAASTIRMSPETATAVAQGDAPKGDVVGTARLAGIQAAKRTWELVPLAHPLELDFVDVELEVDAQEGIVSLEAEAGTTSRTGVEMEAMTACAVAALTVYDMVKGMERGVRIERIELLAKSGGRSGEWRRAES